MGVRWRTYLGLFAVGVAGYMPLSAVGADDWLRFRGPNGSGVSSDPEPVPATWSETENLRWRVALPGPGSSSPIIVGDKVLVTCWSGYGTDQRNPGDQKDLKRHLICFQRGDGTELWNKEIAAELPEDVYGGMFAEHGYASHTPVSDGEKVFAFFGKSGVVAFDLEGNELWRREVGTGSDSRGWGSASSPVLQGDLVIVPAFAESQTLYAFNKNTGEEAWKFEAEGFSGTWGTPVIVPREEGKADVVIGVPYEIWAFDAASGKVSWYAAAMDTNTYCSSVVTDGEVVYGIEGRGGGSIAVRANGEGDVTQSHVVWSGRDTNRIGTPILHEGRIYFIAGGIANCIDAKTGESIYRERLTAPERANVEAPPVGQEGGFPGRGGGRGGRGGMGGQDYSSPILVDGKIIYVTRGGDMYVVKAGAEFEQLGANRVTSEREDFSSSPATSGGDLFIRSSKHLYCIGLSGS